MNPEALTAKTQSSPARPACTILRHLELSPGHCHLGDPNASQDKPLNVLQNASQSILQSVLQSDLLSDLLSDLQSVSQGILQSILRSVLQSVP